LEVVGHLIGGIVPLYQEASKDGRRSIPIGCRLSETPFHAFG
jgi:hypothetical protein